MGQEILYPFLQVHWQGFLNLKMGEHQGNTKRIAES